MWPPSITANDKRTNNNKWEVLCPFGTCSLAEAEEGANTVGQAQVTASGWSPTPWFCLIGINVMKLPCLWKRNMQPHTVVYSTLFIEVGVHWGWPDLWLISTTLCSSKSICIQVNAEQQGAMLSNCACESGYLVAAPGISGHLRTHRWTYADILALPLSYLAWFLKSGWKCFQFLSTQCYDAANSLFSVPTLAKIT